MIKGKNELLTHVIEKFMESSLPQTDMISDVSITAIEICSLPLLF